MNRIRPAVILSLFALLSGCATVRPPQIHVTVDSLSASTQASRKHFVLLPGNKDTPATDLQFREYAAYINRALVSRGYVPAEGIEKADLAIFVVYGIGNPQQHQYSYSIPTWGQTGISSSSTYGTLNTYGGYGTYRGTTTHTPTYGITGSTSHIGTYTTYFRFLVLDALDLSEYKQTKKEVQLWKTTITSAGSSGDLRRVFPYMVTASMPHIGTNTGQQIKVVLEENDPAVLNVKSQAPTIPKQ